MVVVAITGGIGSGKSTVAAQLGHRGAIVIDLDEIARQVVAPGGPAYQGVVDHFGPAVVRPDGTLDRAAVAARAFSDPRHLSALNAVTHPAIEAVTATRLAEAAASEAVMGRGVPVVLDIPLLSEATRAWYHLAGVIVVDTPVELAIHRLVDQRGLAATDADARVRAQASREERRRLADFVVDNSGSRADLEASVEKLWEWLTELRPSVDGAVQEPADADGAEHHQEHQ